MTQPIQYQLQLNGLITTPFNLHHLLQVATLIEHTVRPYNTSCQTANQVTNQFIHEYNQCSRNNHSTTASYMKLNEYNMLIQLHNKQIRLNQIDRSKYANALQSYCCHTVQYKPQSTNNNNNKQFNLLQLQHIIELPKNTLKWDKSDYVTPQYNLSRRMTMLAHSLTNQTYNCIVRGVNQLDVSPNIHELLQLCHVQYSGELVQIGFVIRLTDIIQLKVIQLYRSIRRNDIMKLNHVMQNDHTWLIVLECICNDTIMNDMDKKMNNVAQQLLPYVRLTKTM